MVKESKESHFPMAKETWSPRWPIRKGLFVWLFYTLSIWVEAKIRLSVAYALFPGIVRVWENATVKLCPKRSSVQ